MMGYAYDFRVWLETLLTAVAIGLLLSYPRRKGKGLLISFLTTSWLVTAGYYGMIVLQRLRLFSEASFSFWEYVNILFRVTEVASKVLLLLFVIGLKSQGMPGNFGETWRREPTPAKGPPPLPPPSPPGPAVPPAQGEV